VAPAGPSSDPSELTLPTEPLVEIVEIAVAPLPSAEPLALTSGGPLRLDEGAGASFEDAPQPPEADNDAAPENPVEALSPAVRRLVRQYDLDVTGVHGTGPGGRLRVGDVIGLLGGRADTTARGNEPRSSEAFAADGPEEEAETPARGEQPVPTSAPAPSAAVCTVFECDLGRVLGHRKRERQNNVDLLVTSYFLAACREALQAVPEIASSTAPLPARLGVSLAGTDGDVHCSVVDADDPPLALDERLRAFDRALRAGGKAVLDTADLLIDNYGAAGSVLMTPTALGAGGAPSVGIGRMRRGLVMKNVDGDEAPRVGVVCYVTLTFVPHRIAPPRANRFLAELVRVLEHWPEK
ncbi:MAG TPA: E3 binding domain-containing protein, partial [Gammaproteobacteria bacterium]|nr:E3 binding domain-containing protein [Gammaproteobacteria bacterium]